MWTVPSRLPSRGPVSIYNSNKPRLSLREGSLGKDLNSLRYVLMQIRDPQDPMRAHERGAFARVLACKVEQIKVLDALTERLTDEVLDGCDLLVIGGSGAYSACADAAWLDRTLEGLRRVYDRGQPTFASCWGFQALARALGGNVVHDASNAEVGSFQVRLTEAGRRDPIFGRLPNPFWAQMGHMDHVVELPPRAVLLASSERVAIQAYTFDDRPIYATQFHPELRADDLFLRLKQYPEYVKKTTGLTLEAFAHRVRDTPETSQLIEWFISSAILSRPSNPVQTIESSE